MYKAVDNIKHLISSGLLSEAFSKIHITAKRKGFSDISEDAKSDSKELKLMTDYFEQNAEDTSRKERLAKLYDRAYTLVDRIRIEENANFKNTPPLSEVDANDIEALFNAIADKFLPTKEDRHIINKMIMDEKRPLHHRAMTLSALTINLLKYFDNALFEQLYQYTFEDQPDEIRVRAWVATILIAMKHEDRILTQPRLVEHMKIVCEDGMNVNGKNILLEIQMALLASIESPHVEKWFIDAFKPLINEYRKNNPSKSDIVRIDIDTPETIEKYSKFLDMFHYGIDMFYDMFKSLKDIPYFQKRSNWFNIFTEENPDVADTMKALKSQHFPEISEEMFKLSFTQKMKVYINMIFRYYKLSSFAKGEKSIFDYYLPDLYFNKFMLLKGCISDIETKRLIGKEAVLFGEHFLGLKIYERLAPETLDKYDIRNYVLCYKECYSDSSTLMETMFQYNKLHKDEKESYFNLAYAYNHAGAYRIEEEVLTEAMLTFKDDIECEQKLAHCFYKQGKYEKAYNLYLKCDFYDENNVETERKLADICFKLRKFKDAEKYSKKVLKNSTRYDDYVLAGNISMARGKYKTALEQYRHVVGEASANYFIESIYSLRDAGVPEDAIALTLELLFREEKKH